MRTAAFAIALLVSGAAAAQTTTHSAHGTHATGTTMAAGQLVQPSNMNPERDARGIPVISDPAVAPAGWNGAGGVAVGGPLVDPATGQTMVGADASYPACTATVTDNCVQAYARGRTRR